MAGSDKQPTINDVARLAGVSKKTVSRVINRSPLLRSDTREKVERIIAELGYVPKQYPELDETAQAEVGEFLQALDDHDDVHRVWAAVK